MKKLGLTLLVMLPVAGGCGAIDPVARACGPVAEFAGPELEMVIESLRGLRDLGWDRTDVSPAMFAECASAGDPVQCGYCMDAILDQVWP